ncbi:MAG: hypothetical protein M1812_001484 [Candelaria pacifica]|nr:MAG: hypothetical protein M1812_001484 [Candelaria pacifica]
MLQEASTLFNENYGVWGPDAPKLSKYLKAGSRVRLNKDRLRSQCLPDGAVCSYIRVYVNDVLAGNAFACRWTYDGKTVCWITQLVVHSQFRERGLAVGMLHHLRQHEDKVYGIMSSHPAACLAFARAFGNGLKDISLDYISSSAHSIVEVSPVEYIKDARLRGSLFKPDDTSGAVSCVDTNFFVDHDEPLQALESVRKREKWSLGELPEGYEFVLIIENTRRATSKTGSLDVSLPGLVMNSIKPSRG